MIHLPLLLTVVATFSVQGIPVENESKGGLSGAGELSKVSGVADRKESNEEFAPCLTNVDFGGNDLRHIDNITTKYACDKECQNDESCTHFTWINSLFSETFSYPLRCHLKYGKGNQVQMDNVISGARGCTGFAPCLNNMDFGGDDLYYIDEVPTKFACDKKCQNDESCTHFTWLNSSFSTPNSYPLRCHIKNGKGNEVEMDNVVSGDQGCTEIVPCLQDIDFEGDDLLYIDNVLSASACGEMCQNDESCTHFTWLNSFFSKSYSYPLRCHLKNGKGNQKQLDNVISGAQACYTGE